MKKICSLILAVALVFSVSRVFSGCTKAEAANMMEGISANPVEAAPDMKNGSRAAADFGVRLFQAGAKPGHNSLISPLSVLYALAMTANGADGETLEQMEQAFGMSVDEMNDFLYAYMSHLKKDGPNSLKLANSVWFNNGFAPNQDFLQTNADYYNAEIYRVPFGDGTLKEMNQWVEKHTDNMIPEILDKIDPDAVMYLVNALAFVGKWQERYEAHRVNDGVFTLEDGTTQNATFMYGTENRYLEDDLATGFVKNYKNGAYAFVALLPKEGVSVEAYISSLTGEAIQNLLENSSDVGIRISMPQFEAEFSAELSDVLKQMGIVDAFNEENADFSKLSASNDRNAFINRVLHKTYIQVNPDGTKAAAATVVEAAERAECEDEMKAVYLDRPFVYMLIDCENNLPFFIGTMMDVTE